MNSVWASLYLLYSMNQNWRSLLEYFFFLFLFRPTLLMSNCLFRSLFFYFEAAVLRSLTSTSQSLHGKNAKRKEKKSASTLFRPLDF